MNQLRAVFVKELCNGTITGVGEKIACLPRSQERYE
jgi:hypothetical protein